MRLELVFARLNPIDRLLWVLKGPAKVYDISSLNTALLPATEAHSGRVA